MLAEKQLLGLLGIDHHRDDHLAMARQVGRRGAGGAALGGKGLDSLGPHIAHMHIKAGTPQRSGHATPHGAQPHQPQLLAHAALPGFED